MLTDTEILVLEAFLRTARMVGVVAGGLVLVDLFTRPPGRKCRPLSNAWAWGWVSAGAMIGGTLALYATFGERELHVDTTVARVIQWICLANGLVTRSAGCAERPRRVWLVAALLGVMGLLFSLADAFWIR